MPNRPGRFSNSLPFHSAVLMSAAAALFMTLACAIPFSLKSSVDRAMSIETPAELTVVPDVHGYTFEELWDWEVSHLAGKRLQCNSTVQEEYQECLDLAMQEGKTAEKALAECYLFLDGLEENDSGGTVDIFDQAYYYRDKDNQISLIYPSEGGTVTGWVDIAFEDNTLGSCAVRIKYSFTGKFDPLTCEMSGSGDYTSTAEGSGCVGYQNQKYATEWQATLLDGHVNGFVGDTGISFDVEVP